MIEDPTIYLTPKGFDKFEAELKHLTMARRSDIANRIRESKEHGEFADDNTEMDEIKFEQALIENRISELKEVLGAAIKLRTRDIPTDVVGLGSIVTLKNPKKRGEHFDVRIVTPFEADPDNDMISRESPLGSALLGRKKGDKVEINVPAGLLSYVIEEIKR